MLSSAAELDSLFAPNAQIFLYRVIQEALTNVAKHACATRVRLAIEQRGDEVTFAVTDDGQGFDVEAAALRSDSDRGIGLATMEARARMLGGRLHIRSEKGRGTRIEMIVPMRRAVPRDAALATSAHPR